MSKICNIVFKYLYLLIIHEMKMNVVFYPKSASKKTLDH